MRLVSSSAARRPILRIGARAQRAGQLRADLDFVRDIAGGERLRVGVDGEEFGAVEPFFYQTADGVQTAAAHANDFNARAVARLFLNFVFECVEIAVNDRHVFPFADA